MSGALVSESNSVLRMKDRAERYKMSLTKDARVATVILNYDDAADTLAAVDSLRLSENLDQRLIVVDNNPDLVAQTWLASRLNRGIEYVATGSNLGYAAGNNVGIRVAMEKRPEFLWILNPDVRVTPTTLTGLLAAATDAPDAGIVGGRILHGGSRPQSIWFDGGIIDASRQGATSHVNSGKLHDSTPSRGIVDVDYVTGACMLMRTRAVAQVGQIPEDYFLYFEETDYCKRMQAAGWRTVVNQAVVLSHFKRSSGDLPTAHYLYYMTRNRIHFADAYFVSEGSSAAALADFTKVFLDPWRQRVAVRAPHWLNTFDAIVATAIADADDGKMGKADILPAFPSTEDGTE